MQVEVQGAPIHVTRDGTGEPALLLHGVPDTADIWEEVIAGIRHRYTCHAPDLPGFHRSGLPDDWDFSLQGYADFVRDLLDALGIQEPVTLVIHDWGGIFGMAFASSYPERVARIVGGSFPFSHLYRWHIWARIWQTPGLGELSMALLTRPAFRWAIGRGSRRLTPARIDAMYRGKADQPRMKRTILALYRSVPAKRFQLWQSRVENLARQVPLDLIWGDSDPYVPLHQARLLHPRRLQQVPACGHWVPAEAPEAYVETLLERSTQSRQGVPA